MEEKKGPRFREVRTSEGPTHPDCGFYPQMLSFPSPYSSLLTLFILWLLPFSSTSTTPLVSQRRHSPSVQPAAAATLLFFPPIRSPKRVIHRSRCSPFFCFLSGSHRLCLCSSSSSSLVFCTDLIVSVGSNHCFLVADRRRTLEGRAEGKVESRDETMRGRADRLRGRR